jgi:acetylornithine deacetylase/succinyl-diaminopimelate desuccinylase-like protein
VSGNAPNPAFELARLLALLHDADGRIAIPGFYDDVEPLPEDLRQALAELSYSDEDWLKRSESGAITGEKGYTVLERLWLRPAVEVTSIIAGDPTELLGLALQAPVLFFGTGLVEDHWHDSDESVSLEVLMNGAVTLACFWDELAKMQRAKDDGDGHLRQ